MPLRRARVGRVGVIGAPVAKTAVVAAAVSPGPSPVAKTAVVAAAVTPGPRRTTPHLRRESGRRAAGGEADGSQPWRRACDIPRIALASAAEALPHRVVMQSQR